MLVMLSDYSYYYPMKTNGKGTSFVWFFELTVSSDTMMYSQDNYMRHIKSLCTMLCYAMLC